MTDEPRSARTIVLERELERYLRRAADDPARAARAHRGPRCGGRPRADHRRLLVGGDADPVRERRADVRRDRGCRRRPPAQPPPRPRPRRRPPRRPRRSSSSTTGTDYIGEDDGPGVREEVRDQGQVRLLPRRRHADRQDPQDGKGGGYDVTYPDLDRHPGLSADGVIQPLDHSLIPNIANLGPAWPNPGYDPGNELLRAQLWWTTGYAWNPDKIAGRPDELGGALGPDAVTVTWSMLDDVREVFAVAALPARPRRRTPPTPAELDADAGPARAAEAAPAEVHRRRHRRPDRAARSGSPTPGPATGGRCSPTSPTRSTSSRPRGRSAARTRWSSCPGRQHPIAAHLLIDFNLDAQVSAATRNYIGYMGPNDAAQQYIDPAILERPAPQPGQDDRRQARASSLDLAPADLRQVHRALERAAGREPAADDGRRRAGAPRSGDGPRPRGCVRRPARLGAGRPRPAGRRLARRSSSSCRSRSSSSSAWARDDAERPRRPRPPRPAQLRDGAPPRVPADLRQLAPLRARSRRSCRSLIGYPIAYWISRYGGRRKTLLLILVMLPFWTSYLIRTYAWMIILRDNGVLNSILQAIGLTERADHPAQHRLHRSILGHDLRLPAVRDPAALRLDRPPRPEPRPRRPRPLRERTPGVPPRDPAADDARASSRPPS